MLPLFRLASHAPPSPVRYRSPSYEADAADVVAVEPSSGQDNRHLLDTSENQAVSQRTIEHLQASGVSGQELLDKLAQGSATFAGKTEFSQKKWLKKKTEKYLKTVRIGRPTARSICDLNYERTPTRVCFLRPDSLANVLLRANVRAGSRVLLLETAQGLVAGAMLERMMGGWAARLWQLPSPSLFFGAFAPPLPFVRYLPLNSTTSPPSLVYHSAVGFTCC